MLGFSNGGYLTSKLAQHCIGSDISAYVSVGSSGNASQGVNIAASCPSHFLMIGHKDMTLGKARIYTSLLKKQGAQITLSEFRGGHEIPEYEIGELLRKLLH